MSTEGVDEASLQQVQDLNSAVTGATDQIVVGRVERKTVDSRTMDWFKKVQKEKHINRNSHEDRR